MIAVVGATGNTGRAVVKELKSLSQDPICIVRNAQKAREVLGPDAKTAVAELTDRPALEKALKGVTSVFIVTGHNPQMVEQQNNVLDAALQAGVKYLVRVSGNRLLITPDSDSVIYQDRVVHVASWAARFLFTGEQLNQPVGRLSGGERARVLIAQLMLQPADVLLLDEPTNDLDIPTLEILEESLLEYRGALLLVTHDRFLLDRLSTVVLGLDGLGHIERFGDYLQWETWQAGQMAATRKSSAASQAAARAVPATPAARNRLSYKEARELETIEQRIADAEKELQARHAALADPQVLSNAARLRTISLEMEAAQRNIDSLYARWAELERKV